MSELNERELELVAIGASIGSNCAPCIEHHTKKALETGLTKQEIKSAIQLAKKIKEVSGKHVTETAEKQL